MSDKEEKKKKKKGGVLRTAAVAPLAIVTILVVAFNILLLDTSIKKAIEIFGGKVNGAEVNVGSVTTSFSDLEMVIQNIQFTDKNIPEQNLFQIGKINVQLLWDALLRAKIVVEKSLVVDVQVYTKRSRAGEVYPPDLDDKTGNNKYVQMALDKAKEEMEGNIFGDIAGLLGGGSTGDIAKQIEGQLQSKIKFNKLNELISEREKSLAKDFKNLPKEKELKQLQKRIKSIRWKDMGNIAKAPKVLKEVDSIKKKIDKTSKSYSKASKNVSKSMTIIDKAYKDAEASISDDVDSVSKRMKIPKLDQKSIAKSMFGGEVMDKVKEAKKYQALAKKYIPPKKKTAKPQAPPRGKGRNYTFAKKNSYPAFWLKLAKIDSKNDQGVVDGQILNITNDQNAIGKLTTVDIKGDFPGIKLRNLRSNMTIDHRDDPLVKLFAEVGSMQVKDKAISKSSDVKFNLKSAEVNSIIKGTLREEKVDIELDNKFRSIIYDTDAKNQAVKTILGDVAKKTKILTLDASVEGEWEDLKIDVKSNLAQAIQNSVSSLAQEKINKKTEEIQRQVDAEIAGARAQVDHKISKLKSSYEKQLAEGKKQLSKFKKLLKKEEKKAKKKGKNLLKGLKL